MGSPSDGAIGIGESGSDGAFLGAVGALGAGEIGAGGRAAPVVGALEGLPSSVPAPGLASSAVMSRNSMRRFFSRPALVLLSPIGLSEPKPTDSIRSAAMPAEIR